MTEVALPKCENHSVSAGETQVLGTARNEYLGYSLRNEWNINRSHNEKERKKISISEAKLERKKSNKWYECLFLIYLTWFLQLEKLGTGE